jgi:pheromone a factor receptor
MLPAYFLVAMWPLLIGLISAIYCGLTIRSFLQRRAQFSQFISSNSSLTMSRYFRLMALAGVELLCTTPFAIFQIVLNATSQPLDPWVSWQDTHYNFSRVRLFPVVIWKMNPWYTIGLQFNRWSAPFCALIFFAFFGFAAEARKNYRNAISKVLVVCRLKRDPSSPKKSSPSLRKLTLSSSTTSSELPVYTPPPPRYHRTDVPTTPASPDDKGFAPLASAGTVSEFTISAYEKPLEPESPPPRILAGSLSSRASSTSVVDCVV